MVNQQDPHYLLTTTCTVAYRLIEFSQGWYGHLATDEKMFYILDALLILLILMINTFFHFGLYLKAYPQEVKQGHTHRTAGTEMI